LLLLEKCDCRTPRTAAGKATGGSIMKVGKREEGRGKRGAHNRPLAGCFRGIAAQRDGPPEKLAKPADPAEPGAWRVQGIEDR